MKHLLSSTVAILAISGGVVLALSACQPWVTSAAYTEKEFSTICLDNVQYWIRGEPHAGYMSVKIDPETMQAAKCKSEYGPGCVKTGDYLTCPLPE